jgi:PGF-pre-PGF domain-containing protein
MRYIFLCLLLIPQVQAVEDVHIIPEAPFKGDTVTIWGHTREETVQCTLGFSDRVTPTGGEYRYTISDLPIPSGTRFRVIASPVEDMTVCAIRIIPLCINVDAVSGKASFGTSKVVPGTYDIRISGRSQANAVNLSFSATKELTVDPSGRFEYSYETVPLPAGEFLLMLDGFEKVVPLLESQEEVVSLPDSMMAQGHLVEIPLGQRPGVGFPEELSPFVSEVFLAPQQAARDVKVYVETPYSEPEDFPVFPEGETYGFFRIAVLNAGELASADIKFRVENGWLRDRNLTWENVFLARFAGGRWISIPTVHERDEGEFSVFASEVDEFGYFAITAVSGKDNRLAETGENNGLMERLKNILEGLFQELGHDDKGVCGPTLLLLLPVLIPRLKGRKN